MKMWCLLVLVCLGCSKKGQDASASASASASVSSAPASPCSANAWKEPASGLFCVQVPPGFTATIDTNANHDNDNPESSAAFVNADAHERFTIEWYPKEEDTKDWESTVHNLDNEFKNNHGEDQGTFANDKGKFVAFAHKSDATWHMFHSAVVGSKHLYKCSTTSIGKPFDPAVITACKSLTPTD